MPVTYRYCLQILPMRSTSLSSVKRSSRASSVLPARYASIYPKSRSASISCKASHATLLSSSFISRHRLSKCQGSLLPFLRAQGAQFFKQLLKVPSLRMLYRFRRLHLEMIADFSLLRLLSKFAIMGSYLQL